MNGFSTFRRLGILDIGVRVAGLRFTVKVGLCPRIRILNLGTWTGASKSLHMVPEKFKPCRLTRASQMLQDLTSYLLPIC